MNADRERVAQYLAWLGGVKRLAPRTLATYRDSSAARMRFIEGGHSRKSGALYEKRSAGTICAGLAKPCEV